MEDEGGCTLSPEQAKTTHLVGLAEPTGEGYDVPKSRRVSRRGNSAFDSALARLLAHISTLFEVNPAFAYLDDKRGPNAFATMSEVIPGSKGRGNVLFGVNLMRKILNDYQDGDIAVMGVCAHEFAHIFQYQSGWARRLMAGQTSVKRIELHADFMAGYFVAERRKRFPGFGLQGLGKSAEDAGDTAFNNPRHHGTPSQRLAAMEGGYRFGMGPAAAVQQAADAGAKLAFSL